MRINDVLAIKPEGVATVPPEATVRELVGRLAEHNVGALVVSSQPDAIDGIVSERDVVRRLNAGVQVLDEPVSAIMTGEVATCAPTDDVTDLMRLMTQQRIRHVPVVDGGRLVGIVSIGDVVKSRIGELEFERDQLSHYIEGG